MAQRKTASARSRSKKAGAARKEAKGLEGRKAPAFTLPDASGRRVALKDLLGKDVVLYFYPKDDTPGCTTEACGFRDLWREIRKAGAEVVGVSPDGPEAHERFAERYDLPFRLLCDPEKKVMAKTQGVIRSTVWIGKDGRVRRHWTRVPKAEAHPEKVLAALRGEE